MRMNRLLAGALLTTLGVPPAAASAQAPAAPATSAPALAAQAVPDVERLLLTAGRSMVLAVPFDVSRIAITDPKIADAVAVQQREVLIDGKSQGTVSLIVWGAGRRLQYDVVVDPGVTTLQQTLSQLFPAEDIRVAVNDDAIILAQTFAGYAAVALANAHLYDVTATLAQHMQAAMESRAVIEQAKGIVMGERRCTADEAFRILSKLSQDSNRKVRDVAAALVARAQQARGS